MPRIGTLFNLQPARCDILHYRGDTISINVTIKTRGIPVNITGWTFTAHVRQLADGPQVARFDIEMVDPESGKMRVYLTSVQSQALDGDMMWDLQGREEATAKQHTLIRGTIRTQSDVTYPPTGGGPRSATVTSAMRRQVRV